LSAQLLIAYVLVTGFAVFLANQLAIAKHRTATDWMWAAALFPPALAVLAVTPRRATGDRA
jgi:hypothetical protein